MDRRRPAYPEHWEADVALRDGGTAHVRPIRPDDADRLQEMHRAQSEQSIYLRFFSYMPELSPRDLERFTVVDYDDRVALVVIIGDRLAGVGRYDRLASPDERTAEVAFNIADRDQGRGLGSVLLEHLAAAGRERGIRRFVAEVLPSNGKMLTVLREAGFDLDIRSGDGVLEVGFPLETTDRFREVMAEREHRAEARSLARLLHPAQVAVIAAEPAARALHVSLSAGGFIGPVHEVLPGQEVPEGTDLALIHLPAAAAEEAVAACAEVGVGAIALLSGGFAEDGGSESAARQRRLVALVRSHGMRLLGPASLGLLVTDPDVKLDATAAPAAWTAVSGAVALAAQSSAASLALLAGAENRRLPLAAFVSAGNRADVSANDCLQYWEDKREIRVIGLHLDSVGNPRKFSRIARRLTPRTPIVAVIGGSTGAPPPGHDIRTSDAPVAVLDAICDASGVIRAEGVSELLDVCAVLAHEPAPAAPSAAIVADSAALAGEYAALAAREGLTVTATHVAATPLELRRAIETADRAADPPGALLVGLSQAFPEADRGSAAGLAARRRAVDQVAGAARRPVLLTVLAMEGAIERASVGACVEMASPASAVRALVLAGRRAPGRVSHAPGSADGAREPGDGAPRTRREPRDAGAPTGHDSAAGTRSAEDTSRAAGGSGLTPEAPGATRVERTVDRSTARRLIEKALDEVSAPSGPSTGARVRLTARDVSRLLGCYGVRVLPSRTVHSAQEAAEAAASFDRPVVVKAAAPALRHRTDLGAVRLDVGDPEAARSAYLAVHGLVEAVGPGEDADVIVQPMAPPGVAVVLRTREDPLYGPLLSFSLAGDASDLLGDVAYGIPPLGGADVARLLHGPRASVRLFGHGGAPGTDTGALADLMARLGLLAEENPEIADLSLYPVVVGADGVSVISAEMELSRPPVRVDGLRRTLTGPP